MIVVDEPRTFRVLSVDDDLDIFPAPHPDDEVLDAATFRWFLGPAGAAPPPLATASHTVTVDPGLYDPGDRLELRVEAVDREDRALCDASLATCEAVTGCFQRRSWTLEVR